MCTCTASPTVSEGSGSAERASGSLFTVNEAVATLHTPPESLKPAKRFPLSASVRFIPAAQRRLRKTPRWAFCFLALLRRRSQPHGFSPLTFFFLGFFLFQATHCVKVSSDLLDASEIVLPRTVGPPRADSASRYFSTREKVCKIFWLDLFAPPSSSAFVAARNVSRAADVEQRGGRCGRGP